MSKNENNWTPTQRLKAWTELLSNADGVSYNQMENRIAGKKGATLNLKDTLRQDIRGIKALIKPHNIELETIKRKGLTYFKLSSPIDLVNLHIQKKAGKPNADMLNLITRTQGIFPEEFLSDLSSTYKEIIEQQGRNEYVIAFDKSNSISKEQLQFFSDIYHAINKKGLLITRHKANSPETKEQVILYPEFLKQYNSEWHIYGVIKGLDGSGKEDDCSRIPLSSIDDIDKTYQSKEFISSEVEYFEFFDEIVGVEMDPNCKLEDVNLYVSYDLYPIIQRNPIHSSQKDDKNAKRKPGYKAIKINVRKNKELIRKLVSYGKDIIVESPPKLRNQIKKELQKALEQY